MPGMQLRPYRAIFAARFLMMLQYRAAAFAGIVTQFWFGAINVMVQSDASGLNDAVGMWCRSGSRIRSL